MVTMASISCELAIALALCRKLCKHHNLTRTQLHQPGTIIIPIYREAYLVPELKSNSSKATQIITQIDPPESMPDAVQNLLPKLATQIGRLPIPCVSRLAEATLGGVFLPFSARPRLATVWLKIKWMGCTFNFLKTGCHVLT